MNLVSLKKIDICYEQKLVYFWANLAAIFCGSSGDYCLSIVHKESKLLGLFSDFALWVVLLC